MSKHKKKAVEHEEEHEVTVTAHRDCDHFAVDIIVRGDIPAGMEEELYERLGPAMHMIVAGAPKKERNPLLEALRKGMPSNLGEEGGVPGFSMVLERPDSASLQDAFDKFAEHIENHNKNHQQQEEGDKPNGD